MARSLGKEVKEKERRITIMDTRDGRIYTEEELELQRKVYEEFSSQMRSFEECIKEIKITPTEAQMARKPPRIGRNEPCGCGSGEKFKKCCLNKEVKVD